MNELISSYLASLQSKLGGLNAQTLAQIVERLEEARSSGSQVLVIGNGGSASTASHFACDLGKNAIPGDHGRFRILSLTDSNAGLTAYANDVDYSQVFAEQMKNLLREGDIVVAISASGNSPNIVEGIRYAKARGACVVGLSGFDGGVLAQESDLSVNVPARTYEQIEDAHHIILHIIVTWFKQKSNAPAA